jgi:hypothetical protein
MDYLSEIYIHRPNSRFISVSLESKNKVLFRETEFQKYSKTKNEKRAKNRLLRRDLMPTVPRSSARLEQGFLIIPVEKFDMDSEAIFFDFNATFDCNRTFEVFRVYNPSSDLVTIILRYVTHFKLCAHQFFNGSKKCAECRAREKFIDQLLKKQLDLKVPGYFCLIQKQNELCIDNNLVWVSEFDLGRMNKL